jgi:hypothetical protein
MNITEQQAVTRPNWRGVLDRSAAIATLIAIPFMILLMYCAWLPYWMGMYFFILGGLLFGAIWFRLASHVRPIPAAAVRLRMIVMIVVLSAVYLLPEDSLKRGHLARDLTNNSIRRIAVENTPQARLQREAEAAAHVDKVLRRYGPGPLGYYIWNAIDGKMPPLEPYGGKPIMLTQTGPYWIARVVLSIVLLVVGLRMMAMDLTKPDVPVEIVEDAVTK